MEIDTQYSITTGNRAVAHIAYKTNQVCAVYPITPSSEMSEYVEEWSARGLKNIYGGIPSVFEMQSEAGVAGTMHGALQTGSLTTTFTASQGLLLMMPNMFKIAGELTPNVIHVATRSLATHALSVFCDHSDIMAVRNSGYAFLGGASVQEAHDFALIAQAATLESRIPFVHFFDGFRTSHETSKIQWVPDNVINAMMDRHLIAEHQNRRLNPNRPVLRGTSQGPDVFFQSREAVNSFYGECPEIVQNQMDKFAELTGRSYRLFDYTGHPQAEHIVVAMGSATETIEETVISLNNKGEKTGLIKVRLFRPFSTKHLLSALPASCKSIAVLDRAKEPGSLGEPLYLDIVAALTSVANTYAPFPKIVGGRYGLSSKELHPGMVQSIFENLKSGAIQHNFTIGITDDVTNLSLPYPKAIPSESRPFQLLFYGTKCKAMVDSFDTILQNLGENYYVQGYAEIDYKKSESRYVANLRVGAEPIKAPYLIADADIITCDSVEFIENDNVLQRIKTTGILLINTPLSTNSLWKSLSSGQQKTIQLKKVRLFTVNGNAISKKDVLHFKMASYLHACALALANDLIVDGEIEFFKAYITEVDTSLTNGLDSESVTRDIEFTQSLLGKLMAGSGDELPVSALPVDGTFATDTSKMNVRNTGNYLPEWDTHLCTQCGACSMACPQGALRIKVYEDDPIEKAPNGFKSVKAIEENWQVDLLNYTLQVNPEQCTSCNNCLDVCPEKALLLKSKALHFDTEKANWKHFERIPEFDRTRLDTTKVSQQQLQEPLFKYSMGVDGCGEAPYLKLLSQLFGNRMLVANATGASSIFGGALPSTPWSTDRWGRGPAWSNSLFEDNAEFGLGYRLSLDRQEFEAKDSLRKLVHLLDPVLVMEILESKQRTETEIESQRGRIEKLKACLSSLSTVDSKRLLTLADSLVKHSVWIVGGDGWAYDIGYGGLDHVVASGKNVNILVLDNEVYSNTGGQMSKATPYGASSKFAHFGKKKVKKDLGLLAMTYKDVYVASIAIGADQEQTLRAFMEAESYDGPSIIIAYCHSPAHGIDMKNPSQYHKAAVASGQWLLYRNDPRRVEECLNPIQLDSDKPSIPIKDYLGMEKRFARLFEKNDGVFDQIMNELQRQIDQRYEYYSYLGHSPLYKKYDMERAYP
ncbi:4Fe-4S binding protein [Ulvibacterium sp.]|uniref:4Fe-4S binding protein n=1 Tax=Ulvibacterium sp. TaxID=2665914 RepID=UPI002625F68E|nr:4Fe-4S binding protein [Ulvibacterium sp.]